MEEFMFYSVILLWMLQLFVFLALFLLFRQFGAVYLSSGSGISRDGLPIGSEIPDFKAFSMNKRRAIHSKQLFTKPTLIVFISPNCTPCKELIIDWNHIYNDYKDKAEFIFICDGQEEEVLELIATNEVEGKVLWDQHQVLFHLFKTRVTPFGFTVDQNKIVRSKGLCGVKEHIELHLSHTLLNENMIKRGDLLQ